jgi:sterol desaturase/sphingolipid hydroxylase (fatty acid hydroxylase superfamily)
MLIHFVAFCFFIFAFQTLSFLYDTKLVDIVRHSNQQETIKTLTDNGTTASDLVYFSLWTGTSGFIGLLVAFIISLIISIRRRWFWVNSLFAFIVTYVLYRFDLLGWTYLKQIFWYPGQLFKKSTVEFLLNGIILLAVGLLIFFLRRSNQFIDNKKLATS